MKKATKFICIHGHFYQPPRENPWLEAIEVQDSAAPFHDWNERITAECYGPNSRARILDQGGNILRIVNNYARISFNFGPTLLSWMQTHAPEVLEAIVEGDRLSQKNFGGHGSALAQVYSHAILPLCTPEEKRLQVRWGLADFRHRFGRDPEGMWLAETAADTASLEALAAEDIKFTILAPRQAAAWRKLGESEWRAGPIDTTRPYLCRLPSGRSISVFFYDGPVSQAVAFERLLASGERFAQRLLGAFEESDSDRLVHIATDGETYGHHHRFGEMALAYALERIDSLPDTRLTNYGEYLSRHPPQHEALIYENSSWSCAHGVERWRSDCGCNTGRGWHQRWRAPLRSSLERLKAELDALFLRRGLELFQQPMQALDGYISVILERTEPRLHEFLARHCKPEALQNDEGRIRALQLLEMQRHGTLMFTSCGWFFDEISGLEPTQILLYAARALQLADSNAPLRGKALEKELLEGLALAPSNVEQHRDGANYWRKTIAPAVVDLPRVLAHQAMLCLFPEAANGHKLYCYDLIDQSQDSESLGRSRLVLGRLSLRSRITLERADAVFASLYIDRLDMHCFLGPILDVEEEKLLRSRLFEELHNASTLDFYSMLKNEFGGRTFRLSDLFTEEQRRVVNILAEDRFELYADLLERLAREDEWLLQSLARMGHPIPPSLFAAASLRFDHQVRKCLASIEEAGIFERLERLLERGRAFGYQPDPWKRMARDIAKLLEQKMQSLESTKESAPLLEGAGRLLDAAKLLGVEPNLWRAQNLFIQACRSCSDKPRKTAFGRFAPRLNLTRQMLPWNS